MRPVLEILVQELRRLRNSGVQRLPIRDSTLASLRSALVSDRVLPPAERETVPSEVNLAAASAAAPVAIRADKPFPPELSTEPMPRVAKPKSSATPDPALPPPRAFTLPAGAKPERWQALKEIVINDPVCRAQLRPGKQVVLGVGNLDAKMFFVGEAPGAEEEVQGEPFVGPAGELLTRMIRAMGLERKDVYIGNIMNWRPQMPTEPGRDQVGNRPPTAAEMSYCLPYLKAQIEIVAPKVLIALGKTAVEGLLGPDRFKTLGEARGRWFDYSGVPLMVTYHPSYLLRNQTNATKRVAWEDLLQVMERVGLSISEKQRGFFKSTS